MELQPRHGERPTPRRQTHPPETLQTHLHLLFVVSIFLLLIHLILFQRSTIPLAIQRVSTVNHPNYRLPFRKPSHPRPIPSHSISFQSCTNQPSSFSFILPSIYITLSVIPLVPLSRAPSPRLRANNSYVARATLEPSPKSSLTLVCGAFARQKRDAPKLLVRLLLLLLLYTGDVTTTLPLGLRTFGGWEVLSILLSLTHSFYPLARALCVHSCCLQSSISVSHRPLFLFIYFFIPFFPSDDPL